MRFNVPIWNLDEDDTGVAARTDLRPHHSAAADPLLDYEMADLTWEDGKLCFNGLGLLQCVSSETTPSSSTAIDKDPWELPRANFGTLESLVGLATHQRNPPQPSNGYDEVVPWMDCRSQRQSRAASDALVPCEASASEVRQGNSTCVMGYSTRVDSRILAVDGCRSTDNEELGGFGVPTTASFRSQGKNVSSSDKLGFTMTTTVSFLC